MTWRPGGPIWSAAVGEGGAGLRFSFSGLRWAGVLQCVRLCGLASAWGNSSHGLHSGAGGLGLGFLGFARGACAGHWAGWACRGAWGSPQWVCGGCRGWGVVRGVRRVGPRRACAVVWGGGGGPGRPGGARNGGRVWSSGCVERRERHGRGLGGVVCCVRVYVRSQRRACVASCRPGGLEQRLAVFCGRGKDFRGPACVFGAPLGQWWEEDMLALG